MADQSLTGKIVLVSGALGGIGLSLVRAYVQGGAVVVGLDIREPSSAEARELDTFGKSFTLHQVDVSSPVQVENLFARNRDALGGLYALVNNVGVAGPRGAVEQFDIGGLPGFFATNLFSMFYTSRWSVPIMKLNKGGRIVNIASVAGQLGYKNRSAYASSKWGVVGLTKSLAIELGPHGITVNAVAPGAVSGAAMEAAIDRIAAERGISRGAVEEEMTEQSALGKLVSPESVAETSRFLCTASARFITGQIIAVDSGTTHLA